MSKFWGMSGGGVDFRSGRQRPFFAETCVLLNGKWVSTWGEGQTEEEAQANALLNAREFWPGCTIE